MAPPVAPPASALAPEETHQDAHSSCARRILLVTLMVTLALPLTTLAAPGTTSQAPWGDSAVAAKGKKRKNPRRPKTRSTERQTVTQP